jgi:hypothetical protein
VHFEGKNRSWLSDEPVQDRDSKLVAGFRGLALLPPVFLPGFLRISLKWPYRSSKYRSIGRLISSTDITIRAHLSLCPSIISPRSRNIGLGALVPLRGKRIEIDELRIVLIGFTMKLTAFIHVHQGLHAPSI